jgi:hypothetical protein
VFKNVVYSTRLESDLPNRSPHCVECAHASGQNDRTRE